MKTSLLICALILGSSATIAELTAKLVPKVLSEPTIRSNTGDGILIENPLKKPVVVSLNCGSDYELVKVRVEPEYTELVRVISPNGETYTGCYLANFSPAPKIKEGERCVKRKPEHPNPCEKDLVCSPGIGEPSKCTRYPS